MTYEVDNTEFLVQAHDLHDIAVKALKKLEDASQIPENASKKETYDMLIQLIKTQDEAISRLVEDRLTMQDLILSAINSTPS